MYSVNRADTTAQAMEDDGFTVINSRKRRMTSDASLTSCSTLELRKPRIPAIVINLGDDCWRLLESVGAVAG